MRILLFFFVLLGVASCKDSTKSTPIGSDQTEWETLDTINNDVRYRIAEAAGIAQWDKVSEIAFTFNVDRGDTHSERSWVWNPKTDDIQFISEKDPVSYSRSSVNPDIKKWDKAFINDKYWLLAPFQLVWNKEITFSEKENVSAPISKDTLNLLTIVYPDTGGYTPGDAYDFFFDKNYRIKEWNYRKENAAEPTLTTTWEDYKNFAGLEIATVHKDSTGKFKLYFTNISVK